MTERTDLDWIRLLKQGHAEAIADLWRFLYESAAVASGPCAYRYNFPMQDREDLAQEAVVCAFGRIMARGLSQFKGPGAFRGYCWVILTREMARVAQRRVRGRRENELDEHVMAHEEGSFDPQGVWQRLAPCLETLSARQREVIELLYGSEALSPSGVGERLKMEVNNVGVTSFNARRKLKLCLEKRGYNEPEDLL